MTILGTPLSPSATKVLLCGSGELGKELTIELQQLGVEVIAIDSYPNAPAMQVAHRSHVISMLDGNALRQVIEQEQPDYIVPEVEAIATDTLAQLETEGFNVIPTAKATQLTMNREAIRRLAAETLGLKTSHYRFAETKEQYLEAVDSIGFPFVIKPIMSSSGKGQSVVKTPEQLDDAWTYAQQGARGSGDKVIVEGFVDFDYEITLLTVRHKNGTSFCPPIGHRQEGGDYQESWQPQAMSEQALANAQKAGELITTALGGFGIFGVELFIKGDQVIFNEVSPRPHDTGLVTLISQDLSEFALHARAILGLPIPAINQYAPAASKAILVTGKSEQVAFSQVDQVLAMPNTQIRLFGKPQVNGHRRMGVILNKADSITEAVNNVEKAAEIIKPVL
ncbi:formate-dependent phosphoribosylglycinamide formyltransferase [Thalassotalea aquiviva]|uniref:formate-dependent phosphoribosylglycinamide formyltransferase n=1 Tax=Thalassotalea aquiviva TaxID=3242415 RepID=UPI00352A8F1D